MKTWISPLTLFSKLPDQSLNMKKALFLLLLIGMAWQVRAQGLLDELDETFEPEREFTQATFETTRIINGHSIENPAKHVLLFIISHRFGPLNSGLVNFFGLDQSNIRIGLEYGINDILTVGIGRSSNPKTLDGFAKLKLLRQSTGTVNMPVSLSLLAESAMDIAPWRDPNRENKFSHRLAYTYQLLLARKFSKRLSLQFSPTYVHKNIVPRAEDSNGIAVAALGGRYKVGRHIAINAEYGYILPLGQVPEYAQRPVRNSFSLGVDIETGGHVFQFQVTNTLATFNRGIWSETTDNWLDGGIHLGFNITRVFTIEKRKTGDDTGSEE